MNENPVTTIDTERVVKKLRGVTFLHPLYEAVTNSLEAKATEITIDLFVGGQPEGTSPANGIFGYLDSYRITDNGVGFNEENYRSFHTYMSSLKSAIGCKGIGHFTWLAVFNTAEIISYTGKRKVSINFGLRKSEAQIEVSSEKRKTIVHLYDSHKNIVDRPRADLDRITTGLFEHLFIKFILLTKAGKKFKININMGKECRNIDSSNLPKIEEQNFKVVKDSNTHDFKFYHYVEDPYPSKQVDIHFCADGRTVKSFNKSILSKNMLNKNVKIVGLVESKYLDENANDDRMDFSFPKTNVEQRDIDEQLRNVIGATLYSFFPELNLENEKVINDCITEYPHLVEWIRKDDSLIKEKDLVIKNAKEKYDKKKESVRVNFSKMLDNASISQDDFDRNIEEMSYVQALELAEYIYYRERIVEGLRALQKKNEPIESFLHNIFMQMKTTAKDGIINPYSSNMWLFDDKFMSYTYIASDIQMKAIKKELDNNISDGSNRKAPDVLIVLSRDSSHNRDAVVIEFKGLGASKSEKKRAISELPENILIVKEKIGRINQIWGYTVTSIDGDLEKALIATDYTPLFVSEDDCKIYYKYHKNINAHTYVLDVMAVIGDAETRNRVFLNILENRHNGAN